ncbi:hypothetical protein BDW75DRAFT_243313 [Aspergillus navahoensis]
MLIHKALVLHARDKPLALETVPRPVASSGDAIVRILAADIVPYMGDRNATYAEYARFPLENLHPLNEELLLENLGYSNSDLCLIPLCVSSRLGGCRRLKLKPARWPLLSTTGQYGGSAVDIALAMAATVIAAGRNSAALENLQKTHGTRRLRIVQLTDDTMENTELFRETGGKPDGVDVYLDLSPPAIQGSAMLAAGIRALRAFGRCVVLGGTSGNVEFPYLEIMFKSIRIQGRFMLIESMCCRYFR